MSMVGYLDIRKYRYVVTDFEGKVIADDVQVIGRKRTPQGWVSSEMLYIRFWYQGTVWSGNTPGASLYVKARKTKLASLNA